MRATSGCAFARHAGAFAAPHFVEMVLAAAGRAAAAAHRDDARRGAAARRGRASSRAHRERLCEHTAPTTSPSPCSTTRTGEWLAWEGSGDYFDAQHGGTIDGVVTPRQPGSALKPFTYALAFEHGLTPGHGPRRRALALPDRAKTGVLYSPRNYDGHFRGPLLARRALAGSENVPAVALASEVGVPPFCASCGAPG